jgi:hypothetical protein
MNQISTLITEQKKLMERKNYLINRQALVDETILKDDPQLRNLFQLKISQCEKKHNELQAEIDEIKSHILNLE